MSKIDTAVLYANNAATAAAEPARLAEAAQWYALASTWASWAGDTLAAQDYAENMRACVRAAGRP